MKRNSLTVLVGALLVLIFVLLLFTFQVRQTEIALVTTFDKPARYIDKPGFKWKWPPPIQKVYKFDKRIQSFDQDKVEQTLTRDNLDLIVQVYVGWSISKPDVFFSSFREGTVSAAQPALEALVRDAKLAVIGRHPFTHFVSTDKTNLRFSEVEREMLEAIRGPALNNYGIDIKFLGIKKLGLPESVTQKVFDRMIAERQAEIDKLKGQGELEATVIKSAADGERDTIRTRAEAEATAIKGQADAEAAKSYAVFEQDPELAIFLRKLRALEEVTKERTTLILDERTPPFDLMTKPITNGRPATPSSQATNAVVSGSTGPETSGTVSTNGNGKLAASENAP